MQKLIELNLAKFGCILDMNVGKHIILQYSWLPTGTYHEIIHFKVKIWQNSIAKEGVFFIGWQTFIL
jgi:hypothetical protein